MLLCLEKMEQDRLGGVVQGQEEALAEGEGEVVEEEEHALEPGPGVVVSAPSVEQEFPIK